MASIGRADSQNRRTRPQRHFKQSITENGGRPLIKGDGRSRGEVAAARFPCVGDISRDTPDVRAMPHTIRRCMQGGEAYAAAACIKYCAFM